MTLLKERHKWFGGVLLIAGTTIGGGMMALPISTGLSGFLPSSLLIIAYWVFMTYTAFLLLEVNLWMQEGANLISMAHRTIGKWAEWLSWITYLFLLYMLTTAYIAGSGSIFLDWIEDMAQIRLPPWCGPLPLLLVFGFFVWLGTEAVDLVNRLLMVGLFIAYGILLATLMPTIDISQLEPSHWSSLLLGVSIVSVSFGFHIIIPTLTTYMHHDVEQLKKSLWIGSLIPLVVYLLWQTISLGNIPQEGTCSLHEAYDQGLDVVTLIVSCLHYTRLQHVARFLSFFMILTSFLGVSISLSDFLSDGLKIQKKGSGKAAIYGLTFLPPLLFVWYNPKIFITALEYAGAFGVVILLAILPALMVWYGRYKKGFSGPFRTWGGKPLLALSLFISFTVILTVIATKTGWLTIGSHHV